MFISVDLWWVSLFLECRCLFGDRIVGVCYVEGFVCVVGDRSGGEYGGQKTKGTHYC